MLRILLIDDSLDDRILIIRQLNQEFSELQIKQITNLEEFAQAIEAGNFDLVITDYQLFWSNGITLLQAIKSRYPNCPVVMFTNSGSQEVAVEAMKSGLDDYIIKSPQYYIRLRTTVRSMWKRAEERRRATRVEIRLQSLLTQLNVGVFRSTVEGQLVEANAAFLNLLGVNTLAQAQAMNLPELLSSPQEHFQQQEQGQPERQLPTREFQLRRADGTLIWVFWSQILTNIDGELFIDGLVEDITPSKQLEAARRESEERFRLMADKAPVLLWMSDVDKRCYFFNKTWLEFTGRTMEQERDNGWVEGVHPEDREQCWNTYTQAFDGRQDFRMEYRLKRFDGEYRWLLDTGTPRYTSDGSFVGYIGSCLDISDVYDELRLRKQLEETLRQKAEELAQANRLKDEFLASLSHELRTPLNAILGWSQILLSRPTDPVATTRALETIKRNAQLQTRLVDDILNVSHLISGKFQLRVAPVNLTPIVRTVMEVVRPAAEAKDIRLKLRVDATLPMVSGDANRLQQLIWNLLSNAIKFTPQQGQVEVQLKRVDAYAQLIVRDTGIGISADFLPYVFDRFRQADSSTTRAFGGLGLGLSLVRHLVELHGGTVQAESLGEGQGATFTVQLPEIEQRQLENQPELPVPRMESEVNDNTTTTLEGLRVLVVDDEEDVRELLIVVFEEYKVQVTAVASAAEALDVIRQSVPDVLLCDIGIPKEDGYTLIRKVRAMPPEQGGEILAIALTAYAREEDRQQALEAGFQMHVPKPIEPNILISLVATLVGRSEAA